MLQIILVKVVTRLLSKLIGVLIWTVITDASIDTHLTQCWSVNRPLNIHGNQTETLTSQKAIRIHVREVKAAALWNPYLVSECCPRALYIFLLAFRFSDIVQWNEVCESAPVSKHQAETCFSDLADAFITLQQHSKYWTEDDIVSVIDELTGEMTQWLKASWLNHIDRDWYWYRD